MKHYKRLTFGMILAMMIAIVPMAIAGPNSFDGKGHGHRGKGGRGFGKMMGLGMLKAANLTEAQKSKAVEIIKSHLDDIKAKMNTVAQARQAMASTMHDNDATEASIREAHKNVAAAQEEVVVLRFTIMKELRSILTEEQLAAIETKRTQRIERMKQKSENRWTQFEAWLDEFAAQ